MTTTQTNGVHGGARAALTCEQCGAVYVIGEDGRPHYMCRCHDAAAPKAQVEPSEFSDLAGAHASIGRERDWFAEGAIEGAPLVVLASGEKVGKSWILIDLAVSTVLGTKWLGAFAIKRPGEAWYVDCEYGAVEFARRCARIIRAKGHEPREVLPRIKHIWGGGFQLATDNTLANQLAVLAKVRKPKLVVIDPWRNVISGDENSAADTIASMSIADQLRSMAEHCPFVFAHHLNRQGSMSGSRALKGRADLFLEGSDEEQPWFASIGRTLRRDDPISRRFMVSIDHDNDNDDTIATTRLSLRYEGDAVAKSGLSKTALRVLNALRRSPVAMGVNDIKRVTHITNGSELKRALSDLKSAGVANCVGGAWSISTSSFFEGLGGVEK